MSADEIGSGGKVLQVNRPTRPRVNAFTLIELLVVVAVISILAAIALPNFLEAQTRAKTARVRGDMRTVVLALESYRTDYNAYPPASGVGVYHNPFGFTNPVHQRLIPVTTPVGFVTSLPIDPFLPTQTVLGEWISPYDTYDYVSVPHHLPYGSGLTSGGVWRLCSAGPDRLMAFGGRTAWESRIISDAGVDYDPTNGTISAGDVVRVGAPAPTGIGAPDDLNNPWRPAILRVPSYREQY